MREHGFALLEALTALPTLALVLAAQLALQGAATAAAAEMQAARTAAWLAGQLLEAMAMNPVGVAAGAYLDRAQHTAGCGAAAAQANDDLRAWQLALRHSMAPHAAAGLVRPAAGGGTEVIVGWRSVRRTTTDACPPPLPQGWRCVAVSG